MDNQDKETDKILSRIFSDYAPKKEDDKVFMARLNERLDEVDLLKKRLATNNRQSRRAACYAALLGFITGCLSVLAIPFMTHLFASILWITDLNSQTVSHSSFGDLSGEFPRLLSLALAAGLTLLVSFRSYAYLSRSPRSPRSSRSPRSLRSPR